MEASIYVMSYTAHECYWKFVLDFQFKSLMCEFSKIYCCRSFSHFTYTPPFKLFGSLEFFRFHWKLWERISNLNHRLQRENPRLKLNVSVSVFPYQKLFLINSEGFKLARSNIFSWLSGFLPPVLWRSDRSSFKGDEESIQIILSFALSSKNGCESKYFVCKRFNRIS